jgi:hypothetical protein
MYKKIYEFEVPREEEVDVTEVTINDKGEEVQTTTKVKKEVQKKFFLRRPNRRLFDDAELYYGVKLSEGIKAGLLTRALLNKRFANDGGVLSEEEKDAYNELYDKIFENQVKMQTLALKTKEQRSGKENKEYDELTEWLREARIKIQEFEVSQQSLFDQTAENRARNKTILWWVLHLAYQKDEGDKESPFFGKGSFDERLERYDEVESEEDTFDMTVVSRFFYYTSFWYVSKTNDQDEFEQLLKYAEQEDLNEAETLKEEINEIGEEFEKIKEENEDPVDKLEELSGAEEAELPEAPKPTKKKGRKKKVATQEEKNK